MLSGFHHVTAISGDARETLAFYTRFLELRLVKRTVNFDDPATHHLYFGTSRGVPLGEPGTLLTVFPWPVARRARLGTGQASAVSFRTGSLGYWSERAKDFGVEQTFGALEFGDPVLTLRDPFGLAIKLVERVGPHALERIHSVTILESDPAPLADVLTGMLGFERTAQEGNIERFEIGSGGDGARIDLERTSAERGKIAPGSIHHLALRVTDVEEQDAWRARLLSQGMRVTLPQNRLYFRSIYFRPHRSVLFELATFGPGFTVDEPADELGKSLCLPPWLESERSSIESRLAPLGTSPVTSVIR